MARFLGTDEITGTENVLDSRTIEERIEELESELTLDFEDELETLRSALTVEDEDGERIIGEAEAKAKGLTAQYLRFCLIENEDEPRIMTEAEAAEADLSLELEEFKALTKFRDEVNSSEWNHGLTLIAEDYFTEYAEDLVKDIGDLPRDIPHYIAIDWEKTAENIKVDYSEADLMGSTYLFRD